MWTLRVNKSNKLRLIDFFLKNIIEEGIVYIHLFDNSTIRHGNGENNPNYGRFDDGTKRFIKVDSRRLMKSFNN